MPVSRRCGRMYGEYFHFVLQKYTEMNGILPNTIIGHRIPDAAGAQRRKTSKLISSRLSLERK